MTWCRFCIACDWNSLCNFLLSQVARRIRPEGIATHFLCPGSASPAKVIIPTSPTPAFEILRFITHLSEDLVFLVKTYVAEPLLANIAYCPTLPVGTEVYIAPVVHINNPVPCRTPSMPGKKFFHLNSKFRLTLCNT